MKREVFDARNNFVVQSNNFIQKSKFDLTFAEQRALRYIISKVKPHSDELEYVFDIREYAKVCGLDCDAGVVYEDTKKALQNIRNKSWWFKGEDESETLVAFFSKARMDKRSGKVKVRFDEDMIPHIINLLNNYTQYPLINTLAMKSVYSTRIYELLLSLSWRAKSTKVKEHTEVFCLNYLKGALNVHEVASYKNFSLFRAKVLIPAQREINQYTDIEINYTPSKKGRKVVELEISIKYKNYVEAHKSWVSSNEILDGNV